jgi:hypothetical protein
MLDRESGVRFMQDAQAQIDQPAVPKTGNW